MNSCICHREIRNQSVLTNISVDWWRKCVGGVRICNNPVCRILRSINQLFANSVSTLDLIPVYIERHSLNITQRNVDLFRYLDWRYCDSWLWDITWVYGNGERCRCVSLPGIRVWLVCSLVFCFHVNRKDFAYLELFYAKVKDIFNFELGWGLLLLCYGTANAIDKFQFCSILWNQIYDNATLANPRKRVKNSDRPRKCCRLKQRHLLISNSWACDAKGRVVAVLSIN